MFTFIGNLHLSKKLLIAPGIVLVLMLLTGIINYFGLNSQNNALKEIYEIDFVSTADNYDNFQTITEVHANMYKFISWARAGYSQDKLNSLSKAQGMN